MRLTPTSVELLAPVGTWEVLEEAIAAGADAVYLGGKRFNMRMHRTDANFDDEMLAKAIKYAHDRNVLLYITVNNLISDRELDSMRSYLRLLEELQPDALIIQDLAVLELARELNITIPLHASVMMNTHNEHAVRTLQDYGISRVVVNREMTLSQVRLLKERTGIEVEYFIHGDMCVAHGGQCLHSGVLFGQSSNRGRCLKGCRWPYQLVDATGKVLSDRDPGPYKLAVKDMCMYLHLPELIQAGVTSFKIEGRMRTAAFVKRIVQVYRRAIDRYIADPTGYTIDPQDWQDLNEGRSRDFSTCYALGKPGTELIGYSGEREPRFFSQAVKEASMSTSAFVPKALPAPNTMAADTGKELAVRVADRASLTAACQHGANIVYIGGEAFKPAKPWTLAEIAEAIDEAAAYNTRIIVTTPRITTERECGELEQFIAAVDRLKPHGLMVSNIGMLRLARQLSSLPLEADFSLNVFNHLTVRWLQSLGVTKATISLEATQEQITDLLDNSSLPLELIVHGSLEAMVLDHCVPSAVLGSDYGCHTLCQDNQYALLDTAGERHPIKIDQYCRNHLLFAKDLCLLPYLQSLAGISRYRIEGQHYTAPQVGLITAIYRQELDQCASQQEDYHFDQALLDKLAAIGPRELGIGTFRYRVSR
ncbi:peptidase U32 [Anaerosporomusa subterranea]|uniref:Peptidase U32 n=1 Tax=Anaerosporomusa subterranea TaxID=1794912 RepID=A0A154BNE1_ANASB|nr:U32 family peptidase [Anaerosporomusa subterranea]KYZ75513.1 peptidase U32 [Anaerosporomusa subterranea]